MMTRRTLPAIVIALIVASGCGSVADRALVPADGPLAAANSDDPTLRVRTSGRGTGTVTSHPAGIDCGETCSASFPSGTVVTLTATPDAGSTFAGWSKGGCTGTGDCTITLTERTTVVATFNESTGGGTPLTITTTELPNGNRGASYSAFIEASGGSGTLRWRVVDGSLPAGLRLDEFASQTALISGTPTREETVTFTVEVSDDSGSDTQTFTVTINPPTPLVVTLPGETSQPGTVGTFYFQNLFASGGSPPYTWSVTAGQLPPGLAVIAASNGNRIEGTPTTAGTFTFTLTVTDTFGATGTQQTSITISP